MSLRLRMTLLYTVISGGMLLIFGTLVYISVSLVLLDSVDATLVQSANLLISRLRVGTNNQFDTRTVASFQTSDNLLFQVWGIDRRLQITRPLGLETPLDEGGRGAGQPTLNSTTVNGERLRVLSVPVRSARGAVGVVQVALSIRLIEVVQSTLATTLVLLSLVTMLVAGLTAWLTVRQALAPLETVTRFATQITRADDLSQRIPQEHARDDEVGALILAFNQTLERLEQLFSAQRRLLADVSHELRTPLTVIKGNISLIRRVGEADPESLLSIETEVDRLNRLVGDLLLLAQVETGRLSLDRALVELDTVLLDVYQQMKVLAGERITLNLAAIDQVQIIGDRDRLKQVLLNLAGNAIQYTPPGGRVDLALGRRGTSAVLTVSDTGPGIPEEDLPHIFERFYRSEKSRTRSKHGGFGLGLSIAYWIVRNHGGTIEVQSQEGSGTTFSVILPLASQPAAPTGQMEAFDLT